MPVHQCVGSMANSAIPDRLDDRNQWPLSATRLHKLFEQLHAIADADRPPTQGKVALGRLVEIARNAKQLTFPLDRVGQHCDGFKHRNTFLKMTGARS